MKTKLISISISICIAVCLLPGGFGAWGDKISVSVNVTGASRFPWDIKVVNKQLQQSSTPVMAKESNSTDSSLEIIVGDGQEDATTLSAVNITDNDSTNPTYSGSSGPRDAILQVEAADIEDNNGNITLTESKVDSNVKDTEIRR
jgi:hypothetical protein